MQLDTGKTSLGLVGSLRAIVAQEGFVNDISILDIEVHLILVSFCLDLDVYIEVRA